MYKNEEFMKGINKTYIKLDKKMFYTFLSLFIFVSLITSLGLYFLVQKHQENILLEKKIYQVSEKNKILKNEVTKKEVEKKVLSRALNEKTKRVKTMYLGKFIVTAYDLSVQSCGKKTTHPNYGITYSGISVKGQTKDDAMAIAVDPKVIPIGSKILIEFEDSKYSKFNGVYTAVDTGSAVKGKKIDLFYGDFGTNQENQELLLFGVRKCKAYLLNPLDFQ